VIHRQRNVAVGEEGHHVIDVFLRGSAGGHDDRLARLGDALDEEPVVDVGAGDLDDRQVELFAQIHRGFVEGGGHRNAVALLDGLYQCPVFGLAEPGGLGLLDVADVFATAEILVDEVVGLAELQLDGGPHIVEADYLGEVIDDAQAPVHAAPVVVGQFENEQVFKDVVVHD
jgi:hypothetical protein